jgi:hypothetical protein
VWPKLFTPTFVIKLSKKMGLGCEIRDTGSGKNLFRIPGQKGTGSLTRNTEFYFRQKYTVCSRPLKGATEELPFFAACWRVRRSHRWRRRTGPGGSVASSCQDFPAELADKNSAIISPLASIPYLTVNNYITNFIQYICGHSTVNPATPCL